METFLWTEFPQVTHGKHVPVDKRGTLEYKGVMLSLPNGLINILGKDVIGTDAVSMFGISRGF